MALRSGEKTCAVIRTRPVIRTLSIGAHFKFKHVLSDHLCDGIDIGLIITIPNRRLNQYPRLFAIGKMSSKKLPSQGFQVPKPMRHYIDIPLCDDGPLWGRPQDIVGFDHDQNGKFNHVQMKYWAHTSTLTHLMYLRILTGFYPFKKSRKPWHSQTSLCPPEWWYCRFFQVWILN